MAGINQGWYARNEAVDYPIDETASCADQTGARLPTDVLVDLKLRYPREYGAWAFLASLSVGPAVVGLTIEAADTLAEVAVFRPLAVLAVARPLITGRQYPLLAQAAGVAGWAVFGSGANDTSRPLAMRFGGPKAALLTGRAALPYRAIPVTGVREFSAGGFITGVVRLVAESPMEAIAAERDIDGVLRTVVLLRLTQADKAGVAKTDLAKKLSQTVTTDDNVFQLYYGPCGTRPESKTCGAPEPIEYINAVSPDCNGVLTLEFRGCAVAAHTDGPCGIILDCNTGLTQVCAPLHVPNAAGELPSEVPPYTPPAPGPGPGPPDVGTGESIVVIGALPYTECFDDLTAPDWTVMAGTWGFAEDDSIGENFFCHPETEPVSLSESDSEPEPVPVGPGGAYQTEDAASRHVSVWDGFDDTTLGRKVISDIKMLAGSAGSLHNAAVLLNYRPHQTVAGRFVYYACEVDFDAQEFRITRFNGTVFNIAVSVVVPGLLLDTWYRIACTVVPTVDNQVAITATLTGEGTHLSVTLGPLLVSNYPPSTGRNGLGANRSLARFAFFRQEIYGA